jgi:hypothetical protein
VTLGCQVRIRVGRFSVEKEKKNWLLIFNNINGRELAVNKAPDGSSYLV